MRCLGSQPGLSRVKGIQFLYRHIDGLMLMPRQVQHTIERSRMPARRGRRASRGSAGVGAADGRRGGGCAPAGGAGPRPCGTARRVGQRVGVRLVPGAL
jgi:hypothetical protein